MELAMLNSLLSSLKPANRKTKPNKLHFESLEDRTLLSVSPLNSVDDMVTVQETNVSSPILARDYLELIGPEGRVQDVHSSDDLPPSLINDAIMPEMPSGELDFNIGGAPPLGADFFNTSEYMVGDVLVNVILMESNGALDANLEDWTPTEIGEVKSEIAEGLVWWEDMATKHYPEMPLSFTVDFSFADAPFNTQYEPISRSSWDDTLWISDFLIAEDLRTTASVNEDLQVWNHSQREADDYDWAFTIFMVDSSASLSGSFTNGASGYAYLGGPRIVMTYDNGGWGIDRLSMVTSHEMGHIFTALDEYPGASSYYSRSGYYDIQNLNAIDDHPDPASRVPSIMGEANLLQTAVWSYTSSPSNLEALGWRDLDQDGLVDVVDLPMTLTGSMTYDPLTQTAEFAGNSQAVSLPNMNPDWRPKNDMTINDIDYIEYNFDGGPWIRGETLQGHDTDSFVQPIFNPDGASHVIQIRTVSDNTGVVSDIATHTISASPAPDLIPYVPVGWEDSIIVSNLAGDHIDKNLFFDNEEILVDFSCANVGSQDVGSAFDWILYVDDVPVQTNTTSTLSAGSFVFTDDISLGQLAVGAHTIKLVVDPNGDISESLEGNNEYSKTINVQWSPAGVEGLIWDNLNGDGDYTLDEPGLAGRTVYADLNRDGQLNGATSQSMSNNTPVAITGFNHANSMINASGIVGTIADVNVELNITHAYVEDLYIDLIAPNGETVRLVAGVGADGDNFTNTVLDDEAVTAIAAGTAPFTGSFQPAESLTAFDGLDPNGTWTLRIYDDSGPDDGVLDDWTLTLGVQDASTEPTATTHGDGSYRLDGLVPGDYEIREDVPPGWNLTYPQSGKHDVTLVSGGTVTDIDFGNRDSAAAGSISGLVWEDADADGVQDLGEGPLADWTIYIDANANDTLDPGEVKVDTDANGRYTISPLAPGNYTVREAVPAGWDLTHPSSEEYSLTIITNQTLIDMDFGNRPTPTYGEVNGIVWNDLDADGVHDRSESVLEGEFVYVDANNNALYDAGETSTLTDENGEYVFDQLFAGPNTIRMVPQYLWEQTHPIPGPHYTNVTAGFSVDDQDFGTRDEVIYRAVVVGIDDYQNDGYDTFAKASSASMIYDALLTGANWDASNITLLQDGQATRAAIETSIADIAAVSDDNDVVLFYFAGGTTYDTDIIPLDEGDSFDEYLLVNDSLEEVRNNDIRDDELSAWMAAAPAGQRILLLDSVDGGSFFRGAATEELLVFAVSDPVESDFADVDNTVVSSATTDHQYDWNSVTDPTYGEVGFYTNAAATALQNVAVADANTDNLLSAEEMHAYIADRFVNAGILTQVPALYDGYQGETTLIDPYLGLPIGNRAPVGGDDVYSLYLNETLAVDDYDGVLKNDYDPEGDAYVLSLVADASNGALTLNADGSFEYIPVADFTGIDQFTYVINDGQFDSAPVTVTLNVLPPANPAKVTYRAVVVGIADYEDPANNLNFAVNDARDFRDGLLVDPHWTMENITMLLNTQATKAGIEAAIADAATVSGSDDVFLFYFAGHGGQWTTDVLPADETDGLDEYLKPYDSITDDLTNDIVDEDLALLLGSVPAERTMVFLDACNSGGTGADLNTLPNTIVMTSTDEIQLSAESAGLQNGVFTYYVVQAMADPATDANLDEIISVEEVFAVAAPLISSHNPAQSPQLYDGYSGEAALLPGVLATTGSIEGVIWDDVNADGVQNPGEIGFDSWSVFLDQNGNSTLDPGEMEATVAPDGSYAFLNLPPDDYFVKRVDAAGWVNTMPSSTGYQIALEAGAYEKDKDFGLWYADNQFIVSTNVDESDGDYSDGDLSLREALLLASQDVATDAITFDPALTGQTIVLTGTELSVDSNVTIQGLGADQLSVDADGLSRVMNVAGGTVVSIAGLTLTGGAGETYGGAINARGVIDLTLIDCELVGNEAAQGGGISGFHGLDLTLSGSTIAENVAGFGGGVVLYNSSIDAVNSTISGNEATATGGGLYIYNSAADLTNVTIAGNTAGTGGAGFASVSGSLVALNNSIVAQNTTSTGRPYDIYGPVTGNNNLIGSYIGLSGIADDVDGNQVGGYPIPLDPMIAPLALNGGTTRSHAILTASTARDAGDNALAVDSLGTPLMADQRGAVRTIDGTVDIGAYEINPYVVSTTLDELDTDYSDGDLSLREAVLLASQDPSADSVAFAPGMVGQTIALAGTEILLDSDINIQGLGADQLMVDASGLSRVFNIADGTTVSISGITLSGGANVTYGGAIYARGVIDLTIEDSELVGNSAAHGGAVAGSRGVAITLTNTTIADNSATYAGGIAVYYDSSLDAVNSTISGNTTTSTGGGLYALNSTADLTNVTIADNVASGGSGITVGGTSTVTLNNTIVANNSRPSGSPYDIYGSVSGESNLIGVSRGMTGIADGVDDNQIGTVVAPIDPSLAPLALNGGTTRNHALQLDSPARNTGDDALATDSTGAPLTNDQRGEGFARVAGTSVDIGAFENQTYIVSTEIDEFDTDYSDGDLSLREALLLVDQDPYADVVEFDAALSGLTIALNGTEVLVDTNVTIDGPGADQLTIDAGGLSRVFKVADGTTATIEGLTLTGGSTTSFGGAILAQGTIDLTIEESELVGNTAVQGGAIAAIRGVSLTISGTTIAANSARFGAGGMIYESSFDAVNSTISGNTAQATGGGLYIRSDAATLTNLTVVDNIAGMGGSGLTISGSPNTVINNTVVAGNETAIGLTYDISGTASGASNFIGVARGLSGLVDGVDGNQVGDYDIPSDPMLKPLAANNGTTRTHEAAKGSPLLDAGDDLLAVDPDGQPLTVDQRGYDRIAVGGVDIGAYEREPNRPPVTVDDNYSVDEDALLTISEPLGVLLNDMDPDGDDVTVIIENGPTHGQLTLNADGSFSYDSDPNWNGIDTFTYNTDDGVLQSTSPATVTITVDPVNDVPTVTDDATGTLEDIPKIISSTSLTSNDNDIDGDSLTVIVDSGPSHGTLTPIPGQRYIYRSDQDWNGTDFFTYHVNDGTVNSLTSATVTITVSAVNDAPNVVDDSYTTTENTPLIVPAAQGVLDNDTDVEGSPLTVAWLAGPSNGNVFLNSNGSFTYAPNTDWTGTDSFTYTCSDGTDTSTGTVTIIVEEPGQPLTFNVVYTDGPTEGFNDATLGAIRRTAFQHALDQWSAILTEAYAGEVVTVTASMDPLPGDPFGAILGGASPTNSFSDFGGGAQAGTMYVASMANHYAGTDLDPTTAEIRCVFNSDLDNDYVLGDMGWYYGTDGNPGGDIDFVSVLMHEVGHGMGFYDNINTDGTWYRGGVPGIYDRNLELGPGGADLDTMSNAARASAIVSRNLYWSGALGTVGNGGAGVKMYAPNPFEQGSSVSHLDQTVFGALMMSPMYSGVTHSLHDIEKGILADMGWDVPSVAPAPPAPAPAPPLTLDTMQSYAIDRIVYSHHSISDNAPGQGSAAYTLPLDVSSSSLSLKDSENGMLDLDQQTDWDLQTATASNPKNQASRSSESNMFAFAWEYGEQEDSDDDDLFGASEEIAENASLLDAIFGDETLLD
jgi:VCBS repeat-containing protein